MKEASFDMRFMNTWEITRAAEVYADHPLLGPATQTLAALRDATDANSDGWCYWPKPARAAAKLIELIERDGTATYAFDRARADVSPEELKAALRPIKAFRTRSGLPIRDHRTRNSSAHRSQAMTSQPRIYVASLSDYNAALLHGAWIDANQDPEAIGAEVSEMLAASPTPLAEEWAIHDYEGFGPLRLSEWERFDTISAIAGAIADHGPDVAGAYITNIGTDYINPESLSDDIADAYRGAWDSLGDYAENLAVELGELADDSTWPLNCIDWQQAGMELVYGSDIWTYEAGGTVHVFDACLSPSPPRRRQNWRRRLHALAQSGP